MIAAYNEAKVINKTIATLLDGDYPNLDILVVDDGSKDDTAGVVTAAYGSHPRVTVIRKPNGGKASALNLGIQQCGGEIIVALDADTVFARDTVSKLVRHFADPAIGAVSGNVKVGNRNNPLTIWQAVEYVTSQNFDRRGVRPAELYYSRTRRGRRLAAGCGHSGGLVLVADAGRGHGPDVQDPANWATASSPTIQPWLTRKRRITCATSPSSGSAGRSARCNAW